MKSMGIRSVKHSKRRSKCCSLRGTTAGGRTLISLSHGTILRTRDSKRCQARVTARLGQTSSYLSAQPRWTQSSACSLGNTLTMSTSHFQWAQRTLSSKSETKTRTQYSETKTTCTDWTRRLKCSRNANRLSKMRRMLMIKPSKMIHRSRQSTLSLSTSWSHWCTTGRRSANPSYSR